MKTGRTINDTRGTTQDKFIKKHELYTILERSRRMLTVLTYLTDDQNNPAAKLLRWDVEDIIDLALTLIHSDLDLKQENEKKSLIKPL